MKKSTIKSNKQNFLEEGFKGDIFKHHKKYLGTDIPEGYFEKSKSLILNKIKENIKIEVPKKAKKQLVFWMRPQFKFMAAASLVFIFGISIWLQNATKKEVYKTNFELLSFNEDYLMNSLLVDDAEFEAFADATLIHEIVIKAEVSERKIDALFLDSLLLEDSLIDNYTSDFFLEVIIL
tara:strand:+ start:73 stop:609 length:537 start_codon:yes stop_codon:yes gene_type:complete